MQRSAILAYPDDQGEPLCRLVLERNRRPAGEVRTAAWLMCNPSRATHEIDDPTAGRVVHHSNRAGCDRSLVGNVWPFRTPYPAELWHQLAGANVPGDYRAMMDANLDALAMIAGQADIHVVAYGAEPMRRYPLEVKRAVEVFGLYGNVPLYCFGTSPDGHPLHPLARGKFAVRNDATLRLWRDVRPVLPWSVVFADKRALPGGGWADR